MPRRVGLGPMGWMIVALVGMPFSVPVWGQATAGRSARLGIPIPTTGYDESLARDAVLPRERATDGVQQAGWYTARRFDDLPPPGLEELPPPHSGSSLLRGGHQEPRPFTVDYVFLGRSDVSGPMTNVKMMQVGATYSHRFPLHDRVIMTVRPVFDVLFLSGPAGPDPSLPEQLYKVAFDFQGDVKINEWLGLSAGITPGFWTDFVVTSGEDFRLPARLLGTFKVSNGLFLAAGIMYTDDFRRNLLPAAGVIWDVNDDWRLEVLLPRSRSRLVYRFSESLQIYGAFERGGDTYNIRENGVDEDFEYRDWRVMLGGQVDVYDRATLFVEAGAAFGREFRFEFQTERDIGEAFLLRTGIRF